MEAATIVLYFALFAVAVTADGPTDHLIAFYGESDSGIRVPVFSHHFHNTVEKYTPCERDDSKCQSFTMETDEPQDPKSSQPTRGSSCQKFLQNLQRLHEEQPRVKELRYQILAYFDSLYASGETDPVKRKKILLDKIDELLEAFQNLKYDLEYQCTETPPATMSSIEEVTAEEHPYPIIGSVRGVPGVQYPNYTEVPVTSFSCDGQEFTPGFYADLETKCQVFHVCYEHRRESFLCPIGTTFNQPILACDYWYSSNCSLAPHYFDVNAVKEDTKFPEGAKDDIEEIITTIIEQEKPAPHFVVKDKKHEAELDQIFKFLPIKAEVVEFPKPKPVPVEPEIVIPPVAIPKIIAEVKSEVTDIAKAKIAAAKVAKKEKVKLATVAAIPFAKSKIAKMAKAKIAAASAVPVAKAAVTAPLFKVKVAAKIPLVKSAIAVNAKIAAKKVPLVKSALAANAKIKAAVKAKKSIVAPLKTKAMISPLTKKALALGYLKLLKAKKLALMG